MFTRAISRPGKLRVVFRLARGVRAGRLDPQFCGFDGPVIPIAISGSRPPILTAGALFSPRVDPQYAGRLPPSSPAHRPALEADTGR